MHVQWERSGTPSVAASMNSCQPNASTGNKRSNLLAKLRVLEQQGVLAALELLLLLLLMMLVLVLVLMLMLVLILMLVLVLLRLLRFRLRALVQDTDGSIFSDSIRHLRRVDPHGELAREQAVQYCRQQTDVRTCLRNHRIHFTVDAYATITGATVRPIRKPVIPVPMAQNLR